MGGEQYSTIDKVIQRALLGRGDENLRYYGQALVHARRLYETEYIGSAEGSYGHQTARLEVQPDRTVDLPRDYVEYSMLGVRHGEQLVNLLHNSRLVAVPERAPQPYVEGEQSPLYSYTYTGLVNDGVDGPLVGYGYPSVRQGEFTIDLASHQIVVSSQVSPGTVLYLHYVSNNASPGKATPIHPLAVAWFEFYILDYLYRRREPGLAAQYRQDAEQARKLYLNQRGTFQLETVFAAMRNSLARI